MKGEFCTRCSRVPLLTFIETKGANAGICTPCLAYGSEWWIDRKRFEEVMKLRRPVPSVGVFSNDANLKD